MSVNTDTQEKRMVFKKIFKDDEESVKLLSKTASEIVKDYYDPILGAEQNDYMIEKFQSVRAINEHFEHGYIYYLVYDGDTVLGFLGFYPRGDALYLSKFYLYKESRGKGYGRVMLDFLVGEAKKLGLCSIELNVNRFNSTIEIYEKLGFVKIREEKNPIGNGFYMDDYVYSLEIV